MDTCELCERDEVETTVHHLLPKEMGGTFGATANLCIPCTSRFMLFIQTPKSQHV